jgi:hypothetical protein
MDSQGRLAPKQHQKEQYTLKELLDMYSKGFQLVSYGTTREIEVPGAGIFTLRKFPSGAEYCVKKNGSLERINNKWFEKLERLIREENANENRRSD